MTREDFEKHLATWNSRIHSRSVTGQGEVFNIGRLMLVTADKLIDEIRDKDERIARLEMRLKIIGNRILG